MPYNNTPIAPSKEVTGHVSLPLARVQKIINADPERLNVSKNAAFAIALSTEMFIQHLANTTHNVVKAERKPRRNIQYRDVSSAVAKTDNLEFAVDVVPKTTTFKEFKKRADEREKVVKKDAEKKGKGKEKEKLKEANGDAANGGDTEIVDDEATESPASAPDEPPKKNGIAAILATPPPAAPAKPQDVPDAMELDAQPERVQESEPEDDPAAMQLEMEMRGPPRAAASSETRRSAGGFTAINGAR